MTKVHKKHQTILMEYEEVRMEGHREQIRAKMTGKKDSDKFPEICEGHQCKGEGQVALV